MKIINETLTLGGFLENLGISTTDIPQETLDLGLTVGIDDGMGYSPGGYLEVQDAYREKGLIRIWV